MRLIDVDNLCDVLGNITGCVDPEYRNIVKSFIKDEPIIDAVPVVHGEWIHKEDEESEWYCSICGSDFSFADIDFTPYNSGLRYCPDCGAKMDKGDSQ